MCNRGLLRQLVVDLGQLLQGIASDSRFAGAGQRDRLALGIDDRRGAVELLARPFVELCEQLRATAGNLRLPHAPFDRPRMAGGGEQSQAAIADDAEQIAVGPVSLEQP